MLAYLITAVVITGAAWLAWRFRASQAKTPASYAATEARHGHQAQAPVAIIGMSFSLPDAHTLEQLWDNLSSGKDSLRSIDASRWSSPLPDDVPGQAGLIEGIERFDPMFFGISAAEAGVMDPQQRLMMLHIWRAIEDAGLAPGSLSGREVGIFMASAPSGYRNRLLQPGIEPQGHHATAAVGSVGPNRMSYFLNLRGPSETVETACSSSLVAIDRGVAAIRSGQCELVVCGGVNTLLDPALHISFAKAGMLSPSSRCQTFSEAADGYARGEGVVVFVLKDLQQALRDRDPIYAQILGSAVNHGGRANTFTSPSPQAQTALIKSVLDKTGVAASSVGYVEAHGTGTRLGDPIEVSALKQAFNMSPAGAPPLEGYCALGSIKPNIGHLELAAGAAGVLKILAQFRYRAIAPCLHSQPVNPFLRLHGSPFFVPTTCQPWQPLLDAQGNPLPLRAAISSFGFGGVNAHALLEAPPLPPPGAASVDYTSQPLLLPLSARTDGVLAQMVGNLLTWLEGAVLSAQQLRQLAYTLQTGRDQMPRRWAAMVCDQAQLVEALKAYPAQSEPHANVPDGQAALLQPWLQGQTLDWQPLYAAQDKPWKLNVPGYPFDLASYWLPDMQNAPASVVDTAPTNAEAVALVPHWETVEPEPQNSGYVERRLVVLAPVAAQARARDVCALQPSRVQTTLIASDDWQQAAVELFETLREPRSGLAQVLLLASALPDMLEGVSGLLRSLAREQGQTVQLIAVDEGLDAAQLHACLTREVGCAQDDHVRYYAGQRWRQRWTLLEPAPVAPLAVFKAHGVYLISGGLGAIGRQLVRRLYAACPEAKLILTGRSPLDSERHALLASLDAGAQVSYQVVDSGVAAQVSELLRDIREQHGRLDGIFHCAGYLADAPAIDKSAQAFQAVVHSKVAGLMLLDELSRPMAPDFIVNFASAAGVLGNAGQTDYACASALGDAYVQAGANAQAHGAVRPRMLSIDWPVWAQGGLQPGPDKVRLLEHLGLHGLSTQAAWNQLVALLQADVPQALVATRRSEELLLMLNGKTPTEAVPAPAAHADELLAFLRDAVAQVTHFPLSAVTLQRPFAELGLDSIMVTALNARLEARFGPQPKTLFFEHQTLQALADYLQHAHQSLAAQSAPVAVPRPAEPAKDCDGIAIVGVAGRYPGADSLDAWWDLLAEGRSAICEVPPVRWPLAGFYEPDVEVAVASGRSYAKWGGFIDAVADFDAPFFALSPKDARLMDPQERLFLQTAWEALEDAGYTRERVRLSYQNNVGVYAGITKTGYELNRPAAGLAEPCADPISSFSSTANRVSYFFDFNGPSHAVDTMCSSSLTAIHQACEDLRHGNCTLALAGGVNLYLHPQTYVRLCARRMLSSDGLCKSFGLGGNGFVPGEGVGVIVLKRLSDALRDGDNIQGVIRATAVNHGGRTNGYTVPNPAAQAAVIKAALSYAGIAPQALDYIEAHGTGTELGDPIEMRGIAKAFNDLGARSAELAPCVVGSVKSNIGHLEAAAGIAGVTKVLLQFKHAKIVPSLHSTMPNPAIDFAQGTLQVPQTLLDWPRGARRLAGISGFGAGGANAHVLIEAYEPPALRHNVDSSQQIFVLSARSQPQLLAAASRLLAAIQGLQVRSGELERLAYTLQTGREAFKWRLALVETDIGRLAHKLAGFVAQAPSTGGIYSGQAGDAPLVLSDASLDDLAQAWVRGAAVDWHAFWPATARPLPISLPTYPFALKRLWIDDGQAPLAPTTPVAAAPRPVGLALQDSSTTSEIRYSLQLDTLQSERLDAVPLALYVELALLVSARQSVAALPLYLHRLDAVTGPVAAAGGLLHAALLAPADAALAGGIEMYDQDEVVVCQVFLDKTHLNRLPLRACLPTCQRIAAADLYARLAQHGKLHAPEQRYIDELHWDGQGSLEIQLGTQFAPLFAQYHLAPAYLTALLQALAALSPQCHPVFSRFDSLVVFKPGEVVRTLRLQIRQIERGDCTVTLDLQGPAGDVVAQFDGLQIEQMPGLLALLGSAQVDQPQTSAKRRLLPVTVPWPRRHTTFAKVTLAPTLAASVPPSQVRHSVLRDADVLDDLKSAFGTSLMIPTLNRTGFMLEEMTQYSRAFADYAGTCESEVLDLGCAFGVASIAALENGARVLAVDMEKSHLDILQERVTPAAAERLRTQVGVLPDLDFAPESFDAIHAGRVLHFLRPQEVRLVLARMFEWLRPGGKIVVTSDSPFFGYWASNADNYLRRKAAGDPWPAYIEDVTQVFDAKAVAGAPSCINPMDPDVLQRECERLGYQVERVGFFNAGALSQMHDNQAHAGKEHAGVIARKPESVVGTGEYRDGLVRQQMKCPGLGQLDYYSRGQGDTALIFIHGLGCDHAFWSEQVLQFAGSYRVITLDLPMHGANQQGQQAFTIATCARLVAELAQELELDKCILLGHSLGGPIAVSAAAMMPTRARAVVAVETLHDLSPHGREAIGRALLIDAARKEALLDSMLPISDSKGIRQRVLYARMKVPAAVIEQGDREMVAYVRGLVHGVRCPALLVNASGWMPTDVAAARAAGFKVVMIESSEHYLMLDKPYRLNRVIEEFLATV